MSELDIEQLFEHIDPLLYAVSHDLKSSLLTLSLSADLLLGGAEPTDQGQRVAVQGLEQGAKEMERMIDALAVLSRAYRSTLDEEPMALTEVLVDSEQHVQGDPDIDQIRVAVDGRVVQKLLRVLRDAQPDEIVVGVTADALRIESPAPESEYGIGDSPLETLFSSLTAHAGTQVQSLAEVQVQLGRQGSTISFEDGRTVVLVPLAPAS